MEPRLEPNKEAILTLRPRSLVVRRQRERVVGFKEAPNREGNRGGRNAKGIRLSEIEARKDENRGVNLPPLLAAHLERNRGGQPLRSSLTSIHRGHQPSANLGGISLLTTSNPPAGGIPTYHPQGGIYHRLSPAMAYLHTMGLCSFIDSTGFVTLFVRWIEDYPLPDGLKMHSHIGSYDGKRDPDNFLHLFEGAIHIQQKKFTKTYLAVHTIKQKEGKSTRAFITRYTDDTLQILGLHEEQRISGFVHGLRTRSLVKHLSTDLSSTYKGLMEKTYTWIEAKEVTTNGTPNDRKENFERSRNSSWDNNRGQKGKDRLSPYRGPNHRLLSNLSKSPREILATEKEARSFEQPPRMFGSRRSRDMSKYCHFYEHHGHDTNDCRQLRNQIEEAVKSGQLSHLVKGITKERDESYTKNKVEGLASEGREITFPSGGSNSSAPVVIKAKIFGREVNRVDMDGRSSCEKMGIMVSTIHGAIKFHTTEGIGNVFSTYESDKVKEGMKKIRETPPANVLAWTHANMTEILRTITVKGKPFNTGHKLNEYSHVKPIKQKRRGMCPDHSTTACKEVEELTKAGILRKVKHQTWVANPVMGYHQIQMAEEDEDKTTSFTREGVYCYRKMPFGLKNARATYQRLVNKVFYDQIRRNLEAYVDDIVIKSTSEEEMLADIKETFERFRSINMKLNPKKCSFDVEEGSFLGHLITKQGIRANPSKVKAITDVEQLKTLKDKIKEALKDFDSYTIEYIRRNQNKKADALSKLASMTFKHLTKEVLVEVLPKRSIEEKKILQVETKEGESWMTPIHEYLLRCVASPQTDDIIKEVHEGTSRLREMQGAIRDKESSRKQQDNSQKWMTIQSLGNLKCHKQSARRKRSISEKVHRTLPRNSQKDTPFSLTYGFEAKIPISENDVAKDDRGRIKEVNKRRGSKEIASIEEAYY
ncbi:reverse transcriptase domain-containing protein [Tanacetum coccineum]|uniref:Reverse transcriptase domain-containing protein n=1 Tax=Tanacetum coccineum TaxID=301880 RepID=A0ABQ5G033_9ASTR